MCREAVAASKKMASTGVEAYVDAELNGDLRNRHYGSGASPALIWINGGAPSHPLSGARDHEVGETSSFAGFSQAGADEDRQRLST